MRVLLKYFIWLLSLLDMSKLIKYQINKKNTKEKLKEIKSKTGSFLE